MTSLSATIIRIVGLCSDLITMIIQNIRRLKIIDLKNGNNDKNIFKRSWTVTMVPDFSGWAKLSQFLKNWFNIHKEIVSILRKAKACARKAQKYYRKFAGELTPNCIQGISNWGLDDKQTQTVLKRDSDRTIEISSMKKTLT